MDDFLRFRNYKTISKALVRLAEKEKISRVTREIYARLEKAPILDPVKPGTEAIAKRGKARIVPTGVLSIKRSGFINTSPLECSVFNGWRGT